jgi:hypothetical protein
VKCSEPVGVDLPLDKNRTQVTVSNMSELVDAYNERDWRNGGDIILEDGESFDTGDDNEVVFKIENEDNKPKNENQPLVIRPKSIGGATIKGRGELRFKDVENVWLYGINFEYDPQKDKGAIVTFTKTNKCRIARCDFHTIHGDFPEEGKEDKDVDATTAEHYYLRIQKCDRTLIDHNVFHHKPKSKGNLLLIGVYEENDEKKPSTNSVIEYNYFFRQPYHNGENSEVIRIGEKDVGNKSCHSKVRYNLIEECNGDVECVGNKSRKNTYSHNTFRNNMGALSFRHGWEIIADSNIFIDCLRGIRILGKGNKEGENNKIRKNYFKNIPPSGSQDDDEDDYKLVAILVESGEGDEYLRSVGDEIDGNIIEKVDEKSKRCVTWGSERNEDEPPDHNDFTNNTIIVNNGTVFKFEKGASRENNTFNNNRLFHKGDVDVNLPESEISREVVSSLELPEIIRPSPRERKEVGPCSDLSSYRIERVLQTLKGESTAE